MSRTRADVESATEGGRDGARGEAAMHHRSNAIGQECSTGFPPGGGKESGVVRAERSGSSGGKLRDDGLGSGMGAAE